MREFPTLRPLVLMLKLIIANGRAGDPPALAPLSRRGCWLGLYCALWLSLENAKGGFLIAGVSLSLCLS